MSDRFETGPDLFVRTHKVTGISRGWTDIAACILADDAEWGPITHYVSFDQVRKARHEALREASESAEYHPPTAAARIKLLDR